MADRPKPDGDRPPKRSSGSGPRRGPGGGGGPGGAGGGGGYRGPGGQGGAGRGGPGGFRGPGGPGGGRRPGGPGGFRGGGRDGASPRFDDGRRGFGFGRDENPGGDSRDRDRDRDRGGANDGGRSPGFDRPTDRDDRGFRGREPRSGPGRDASGSNRPWDRPRPPWQGSGPGRGDRGEAPRFRGDRPPDRRPFDRRDGPPDDGGRPFRADGDRAFQADHDERGAPSARPPFRSGPPDGFRAPGARSGRPDGDRPSGPGRPSFDRPRFDRPPSGRPGHDRPWRDPASRPVHDYRPGVAPSDLLAEGEELVAGRRPVEEAFVAKRAARRLLVVPQRRQALERLVLHATSLRIPVVEVEGGSLTAVAGFDGHQGIALVVEPRIFAGIDDVLARALERGEAPFILVMDSLEDPQNVGTLLRSAEAAGVHGVLFPTHRQAPLSPAAIKASAGAVEHLLLCPVDDLAGALSDLRIRGLRIAAAEADAPLTAAQADLRGPLAIVVGSEGQGLSPVIRRRADVAVRIPMRGAIGSLNAAVAGSILLFAAVGQRDPGGEGSAAPSTPNPLRDPSADDAPGGAPAPEVAEASAPGTKKGSPLTKPDAPAGAAAKARAEGRAKAKAPAATKAKARTTAKAPAPTKATAPTEAKAPAESGPEAATKAPVRAPAKAKAAAKATAPAKATPASTATAKATPASTATAKATPASTATASSRSGATPAKPKASGRKAGRPSAPDTSTAAARPGRAPRKKPAQSSDDDLLPGGPAAD